MTADDYLQRILAREAVDTGPFSSVRSVQSTLQPLLSCWGGSYLVSVSPSGSFAKGTANKSGTDIDLFLSLSAQCTNTLKEIYERLYTQMQNNGYSPRLQNVSIRVRVNSYDVDLVPGKQQNLFSLDHSLWRRKAEPGRKQM
jgi:tRNA nucleotidyltransferase (CCA-adding enzyme)